MLRVALVFGGRSGEHEVSVVSARSVAAALAAERFEVVPMAIDRAGRWADAATARRVLENSGDRADQVQGFDGSARLDPRLLDGGVDVVMPVLHGPFGEDGTIQGLCEMLDLPYTGCAVAAAAVTMDKVLTKRVFLQVGLPTPRFVAVTARELSMARESCERRCLELPLPLFVKPSRLGSSVGISKVKSAEALGAALDGALAYDDVAVVEEGVPAREIEVAVLGSDPLLASVPGEVVPGHEFYDYGDKYLDDACQLLAPAPLDAGQSETVRDLAVRAFSALGCEGMARVDFLLDRRDGRFLLNEVNATPGFTAISMYPRLLALTGVPYPRLVANLVELALARHERRQRYAAAALRPFAQRTSTRPEGGG
ncbi:MAG: D-alanine--D-alanine ligase family protein [Acidobacteriota bacterium]